MNTEKEQEALEFEGYMSIDTGIKEGKLLIAAINKIMQMYQLHFSKQEILKDLIPTARQMFQTFNLSESYSKKVKFVEFTKFGGTDDNGNFSTYPILVNVHEIVLISRNRDDDKKLYKCETCHLFIAHTFSNGFDVVGDYKDIMAKIEEAMK